METAQAYLHPSREQNMARTTRARVVEHDAEPTMTYRPSSKASDYADTDRAGREQAACRSRHNPALGIMA
jgi:hypothetical protein